MFIAKIFANNDKITSLEEGRRFLETFFEEKFNPERDFVDYLLYKKDRHYEQYFEKVAEDFKRKKKQQEREKERAAQMGLDDQDLMPMDLD